MYNYDYSSFQFKAQYTPPTPTRRRDETVLSHRVRRRCVHEFATSSRRLPTASAMWTQPMAVTEFTIIFCSQCYRSRIWRKIMTLHVCEHSNQLCSVIFVNFYNFFQQWRHYVFTCQLPAQEIVNWITTADGCVHTATHRRRDSTVSSRRRCVLGISWPVYLSRVNPC